VERVVPVRLRIDTPIEIDYYRHGGILPFVLRHLLNKICARESAMAGNTAPSVRDQVVNGAKENGLAQPLRMDLEFRLSLADIVDDVPPPNDGVFLGL
jgi:hypothetical protein